MGHLCGSLGAAWKSHGAPLWLPRVLLGRQLAPLWLPWGLLGGGLAKEDCEGKTSKLAEAFKKKWSGGAQSSSASTIVFQKA